jgi:uncharacterized protein (TIGR02246 family)
VSATAPGQQSGERRRPRDLEELLDREEIRAVVVQYMYAVDAKDWDGWADVLTDDVRFVLPGGIHEGKVGAVAFSGTAGETAVADNGSAVLHLLSNLVVTVDGDEAAGRAYLRYATGDVTSSGEGMSDVICLLTWKFRREVGQWRIAVMESDTRWTSDAIGAPVSRLVAERDIRTALDHYRAGMDVDADRIHEAFHPDATLTMGVISVTGTDQIAAAVGAMRSAWSDVSHFAANIEIEFTRADAATGTCYGLGLFVASDGIRMSVSSRYRDTYERREGVWRISRRDIELRHCSVTGLADVYLEPTAIEHEWVERARAIAARVRDK